MPSFFGIVHKCWKACDVNPDGEAHGGLIISAHKSGIGGRVEKSGDNSCVSVVWHLSTHLREMYRGAVETRSSRWKQHQQQQQQQQQQLHSSMNSFLIRAFILEPVMKASTGRN